MHFTFLEYREMRGFSSFGSTCNIPNATFGNRTSKYSKGHSFAKGSGRRKVGEIFVWFISQHEILKLRAALDPAVLFPVFYFIMVNFLADF